MAWQGTYHEEGVEHYEGEFRNGKSWGKGMTIYPDGSRYEGQREGDKRSGHGMLIYVDGTVFECEFRDDDPMV